MREVNVFKWEQKEIDGKWVNVKTFDFVALFHQFAQEADGEGQSNPVAIIERADGQVDTVFAPMVQFTQAEAAARMTLRDEFAAQAVPGLITEPSEGRGGSTAGDICAGDGQLQDNVQSVLAHAAYSIADAMIAERAK